MSRHDGVSCDNCLTSNFQQKRFKCLICYDYDLCEICFDNKVSTSRHSSSHPMQCILTKKDFDLFYGGEGITMDNPPALTCPLCGKLGFTEASLQEHVNSQHAEASVEVVCPICAAIPAGEPNHVTDDFATHLAIEHNNSQRANADDPMLARQNMRRMFYPGRSVRGSRHQRSSHMHFSSGSSSLVPGFNTVSNAAATPLPHHSREPFTDPIAELLSQLSGVRRSAQQLQNVSTSSQLQELQAQLQLERQRASIIRQQLERIPGKIQTTQGGKQSAQQTANNQNKSYATAARAAEKVIAPPVSEDEDPRLLLSQIYQCDANGGCETERIDRFEQSLFVRELIHSLPIENDSLTINDEQSVAPQPSATRPRAIPVDCKNLSSAAANKSESKIESQCQNDASHSVNASDHLKSGSHNDEELHNDQAYGELGAVVTKVNLHENLEEEVHVSSRRNNGEEKTQHPSMLPDLKKDSTNLRSSSQYSSGASNVSELVRSPSSHPVSSFPVLVSASTEQ